MADEDSNFFDEMAEDAEREEGGAKKAWRLLAASIDETDLPTWVKDYVKRSAAAVADYDMEAGDQAALAHWLGFYKEKEEPFSRVTYKRDDLFDWIMIRLKEYEDRGELRSIARAAAEYNEEVQNRNGSPDAVRKAFEKAREQKRDEIEFQRRLAERGWPDG